MRPNIENVVAAAALEDPSVARRVQRRRAVVEIRSAPDIASVLAAGIHPARMVVYAGGLSPAGLRTLLGYGAGRVVVASGSQAALVGSAGLDRRQSVVIAPAPGCDLDAMVGYTKANLVGIYGSVGIRMPECRRAVRDLLTDMALISRRHSVVLSRLSLSTRSVELASVATQVEDVLEESCGVLRIPRPHVTLTPRTARP